jgi:hypothetical protein
MGAEFVSGHGADLSQRCGKSPPVATDRRVGALKRASINQPKDDPT